jgi:hypothetical protein
MLPNAAQVPSVHSSPTLYSVKLNPRTSCRRRRLQRAPRPRQHLPLYKWSPIQRLTETLTNGLPGDSSALGVLALGVLILVLELDVQNRTSRHAIEHLNIVEEPINLVIVAEVALGFESLGLCRDGGDGVVVGVIPGGHLPAELRNTEAGGA